MLSGQVKDNANQGLFFISDFLCLMELTVLDRCSRGRAQGGGAVIDRARGGMRRELKEDDKRELSAKRGRD